MDRFPRPRAGRMMMGRGKNKSGLGGLKSTALGRSSGAKTRLKLAVSGTRLYFIADVFTRWL